MNALFNKYFECGRENPNFARSHAQPTVHCSLFTVHGSPPSVPRAGFTLVEMLVVIVIIAVLISMLGGAYIQAKNHARRARAETQLHELVKAWSEYYLAYTNWPTAGTDVPMTPDNMQPLFATAGNPNNPRSIPFLSISPSAFHTYASGETCYTDPWWNSGVPYPQHAYKISFGNGSSPQEVGMRIAVGFPNRDRYR